MKYSPFASTKPQEVDPDLEAQKAAFSASGGKVQQVDIKPSEPEVSRYNGKNHGDIGKKYQK